jgi:glyoxylase-like metal-dependent hydrolase (beta-lactamase superfamily II)/rhodanese-related sulfurtransferase
MLVFRQLFDPQSSTYTYLLAERASGEAVLIDPVFEQVERDSALIRELGLTLALTLETHVHADHVTGASAMKERHGSRIALSRQSGAAGADLLLDDHDRVPFGRRYLEVRHTPGHTGGCVSYVLDDESKVFTGDLLFVRGCGRTDFQGGDARQLYRSVHAQIFSLPEACLVYPGHDYRGLTVTSVGEERRFNPRLGGELSENDFVGFMRNLGLPHPKQMEVAVPANLKCGRRDGAGPEAQPAWGPLTFTFAGIWEVEPHWVEEHLAKLLVVDVREPDEFCGPLGRIPGARSIPLGTLAEAAPHLAKDKPVVTVCRAGGRSAQATLILKKCGFAEVANLPGGMLRWRALRLATEAAGE